MTTIYNTNTSKSLTFSTEGMQYLRKQLERDEAFQRRITIIACVALATISAGGVAIAALALTIVPYSTLFTFLLCAGVSSALLGAIFFVTFVQSSKGDNSLISDLTRLPVCKELKKQLNGRTEFVLCVNLTERSGVSWKYLKRHHTRYEKYLTQALNPQPLQVNQGQRLDALCAETAKNWIDRAQLAAAFKKAGHNVKQPEGEQVLREFYSLIK